MKALKMVGKFLLNLVSTNRGFTLPGKQTVEGEETSSFMGLNLNDFVKGLVLTVITSTISYITEVSTPGDINWDVVKNVAWISFTGYITKNLFTNSQTIIKK